MAKLFQKWNWNSIPLTRANVAQPGVMLPEKLIPGCAWAQPNLIHTLGGSQSLIHWVWCKLDMPCTAEALPHLYTDCKTALDWNQCRIFPVIFTGCVHWGFLNAYMQNKKLPSFSNSNKVQNYQLSFSMSNTSACSMNIHIAEKYIWVCFSTIWWCTHSREAILLENESLDLSPGSASPPYPHL